MTRFCRHCGIPGRLSAEANESLCPVGEGFAHSFRDLYVGEGSDGLRQSAAIDRDEAEERRAVVKAIPGAQPSGSGVYLSLPAAEALVARLPAQPPGHDGD